jgi:hypothetical protein
MPLVHNDDGYWELKIEDDEHLALDKFHPTFKDALPRYCTALDRAFVKAREKCEFEFLLTLFRIRGADNRGIGDAYETTLRAMPLLYEVHNKTENYEAARHLQLWIYGHIVEASEPYEILSNLVNVSLGKRFSGQFYPYKVGKSRPESPGTKIAQIERAAGRAGIPEVVTPLKEIWDRNLRNAIVHSDYILYGSDVLTRGRKYTHEEIMTVVTRAFVYHQALSILYKVHIESYDEPKTITVHPAFSRRREEKAVVIVREGHGAAGLKAALTKEEIARGEIYWRLGRFTPKEIDILNSDPTLALLPRSENNN